MSDEQLVVSRYGLRTFSHADSDADSVGYVGLQAVWITRRRLQRKLVRMRVQRYRNWRVYAVLGTGGDR